eukprot:scaffold7059_cov73-Isochrysis_galbana.AAC.1
MGDLAGQSARTDSDGWAEFLSPPPSVSEDALALPSVSEDVLAQFGAVGDVLRRYGALDAASADGWVATEFGALVASLSGENELWLALVLMEVRGTDFLLWRGQEGGPRGWGGTAACPLLHLGHAHIARAAVALTPRHPPWV